MGLGGSGLSVHTNLAALNTAEMGKARGQLLGDGCHHSPPPSPITIRASRLASRAGGALGKQRLLFYERL